MIDPTSIASRDLDSRQSWPFRKRWRIEGCLFTCAPLHIGSGKTVTHSELEQEGILPEIAAIAADYHNQACIPGATLKGNLRAWLEQCAEGHNLIKTIFGKVAIANDPGTGGKAEFHDARLAVERTGETPLPCWNSLRHTYVEVGNSIDRNTRGAADEHLFHQECVPAGVGFEVIITGMMTDGEVKLLLGALHGFNNKKNPVLLGADTASGKGRCRWEHGEIRVMDKPAVASWVKNSARFMPEHAMKPKHIEPVSISNNPEAQRFEITLSFLGPFLVNDPPGKSERQAEGEDKQPDHRPRVDEQGRIFLPAKSFRGAFRSQAEKILRTMAEAAGWPQKLILKQIACQPETSSRACKPLRDNQKPEDNLCLACQLFGAAGWKTVLYVSDFIVTGKTPPMLTQEFVAIDRFTGGGMDGAKFNARAAFQPVLRGNIRLDISRLAGMSEPKTLPVLSSWALGLLALVLRDLKEGDISFGFGVAKGYGTCTATVTRWDDNHFQNDVKSSLIELHKVLELKQAEA